MTASPCAIDEDLSVADAMDRMISNNIRHLLVLNNETLVGVVDVADLMVANGLAPGGIDDVPVASAVQRWCRCTPTTPLVDVARKMERHHFGCAVVVDRTNTVAGIFTITDALRALREIALGHHATPQVVPTHAPEITDEREAAPPRVRTRRILERRNAAPSARDGMAFGTVGL